MMGGNAKLVTKAVHKWLTASIKNDCLLLFINQVRANFRSPMGGVTRPGGWAIEHHSTVRMKIYTKGQQSLLKEKDGRLYGHKCYVRIEKNHLSIPVAYEVELYLEYGKRINPYMEILNLGVETGLVEKSTSWFVFENGEKAQGELNASKILEEDTELYTNLRSKIHELGSHNPATVAKELEPENNNEGEEPIFESD
jgi:recombination protein RecA